MIPAWNTDINAWRCQSHLKAMGWMPPIKNDGAGGRWSLRLRRHHGATATVLDCQLLDFLTCEKNKLFCFKALFCVFSVTRAESNSNAYGIHVPGCRMSIYRHTYLCECACLYDFYRLKRNFSHGSSNTMNLSGNLNEDGPVSKQVTLVYSPSWLL